LATTLRTARDLADRHGAEGGLFLTAGADVQKDRIEVDVWAWGRGLESWLVDHVVVEGGPEQAETWEGLGLLLDRTWLHAQGTRIGIAKLAIDTGYEAPAVYTWARKVGHAQVAPIKGVEGFNRAAPVAGPTHVDVTEGGKKLRRGARLWTIAVATFKSETYRFLRLSTPTDEDLGAGARFPAGYVHLPRGAEAEWLKQLVGEQLVTVKTKRGFSRLEWQKLLAVARPRHRPATAKTDIPSLFCCRADGALGYVGPPAPYGN
jgi:phage terminase large subunit GpA-like protein